MLQEQTQNEAKRLVGGGGGTREPLEEIGKRLRATLQKGAQCKVRVAVEVMRLAEHWSEYREEAGGQEIGAWLKANVDPTWGLREYKIRAEAAKAMRETGVTKWVDDEMLVWLYNATPSKEALEACTRDLHRVYVENGHRVVKHSQGIKVCERFVTRGKTRQRAHEQIRALKAKVAELEGKVTVLRVQVRRLGGVPEV